MKRIREQSLVRFFLFFIKCQSEGEQRQAAPFLKADGKEKLDEYTETLITEYKRALLPYLSSVKNSNRLFALVKSFSPYPLTEFPIILII